MGKITRLMMTWAVIVLISVLIYNHYGQTSPNQKKEPKTVQPSVTKKTQNPGKGLQNLIGLKSEQIKAKYGKPARTSPSAYGYQWWVYDDHLKNYMQIGIENGKVVSVFAFGENLNTGKLTINGKRKTVLSGIATKQNVSLNSGGTKYIFNLKSDDLKARPLVRVGKTWAILYFDTFTNRLAGIRYLDSHTLAKMRPYSLSYYGKLPQSSQLSRKQWKTVESGEDQGILKMTNVIRKRFGLSELKWDGQAATAAFGHSKDMALHHYFDHTSPSQGTVGQRLHKAGVQYLEAGENIAANYPDGIAAMFGWLNSKGHRENLLHKPYTYLGVGVYKKEYTQDFVKPLP